MPKPDPKQNPYSHEAMYGMSAWAKLWKDTKQLFWVSLFCLAVGVLLFAVEWVSKLLGG